MCPMGGSSGDGDDGAVLPIGAAEIVLVASAVGAAMLVSGAAMVVLGCSSSRTHNLFADGADVGPLRADGSCKSANPRPRAARKASAGAGTCGAAALCNASAGRITISAYWL
jgi:hypothetical protein